MLDVGCLNGLGDVVLVQSSDVYLYLDRASRIHLELEVRTQATFGFRYCSCHVFGPTT
jgi:hypothetical protein